MRRGHTASEGQTGAHIFWEYLQREGVEVVFGYPGAQNLPLIDAMPARPIRFVLSRHEQGAAHMADGYARASGRVGVALATSGPGATNLVTGVATAMRDSVPTVFVTGQVPTGLLGTDAFQEVDILGVTRPITKGGMLVRRAAELAGAVQQAFALARTGRPGPVLIDVCSDAQRQRTAPHDAIRSTMATAATPAPACDGQVGRALELIAGARRPLILAGHGVIASGTARALRDLAERIDAPVALTLLGLGGLPARHPLCLGLMGMHGHAATNYAIQRADLLIALGMRFDDRVTGRVDTFAPHARKIHIDVDALELGRRVNADIGIAADLRDALPGLAARAPRQHHTAWRSEIERWRAESRQRDILEDGDDGRMHAPHVIDALRRATGGGAVMATDVGQNQMCAAQYCGCEQPRSFVTSGGMGTMGFGLPAGIGAKLARPSEEVWVVAGDGGFQMTQCELATLVQEQLDVKIAILNNGYLGMVRQWQELFYERRYRATPISSPDFVALARAYGVAGERVCRREGVEAAIARARAARGPALIEFVVEPESIVYPMVPAGAALHEMLRRPLAGEGEGLRQAAL